MNPDGAPRPDYLRLGSAIETSGHPLLQLKEEKREA